MTEVPIPVGTGDNEINLQLMGGFCGGIKGFTVDNEQNIYIMTSHNGIKKFDKHGQLILLNNELTDRSTTLGVHDNHLFTYMSSNDIFSLNKYDSSLNLVNSFILNERGSLLLRTSINGDFGFLQGSKLSKIIFAEESIELNTISFNNDYSIENSTLLIKKSNTEYNLKNIWGDSWHTALYQEDSSNNLYFIYSPGLNTTQKTGNSRIGIVNYQNDIVIETNIELSNQGVPLNLSNWLVYIDKIGIIYRLYVHNENEIKVIVWSKAN